MSVAAASSSTVNGSTPTPGRLPDESAAAAVSSEIQQVKVKIAELEEDVKRLSSDIEQAKNERDIEMVKLLLADKTALLPVLSALQEKENLLLKQSQEARTSAATTSGGCGWVRDLTAEGIEANPGPVYCRHAGCDCTYSRNELMAGKPLSHAKTKCEACDHPIRGHDEKAESSTSASSGRTPPRQRAPAFKAFWQCLCNFAVVAVPIPGVQDAESGAYWLQLRPPDLSQPVHWLGELVLGDYLYVRACYRRLYTMLKSIWNQARWALLLGSPGIGKSMFRCYILHQLCQEHIRRKESFTVILQYPSQTQGLPKGACDLLRFKAGADGQSNEIGCERSPSGTLPTTWTDLLISPPDGESIYYITDGIPPHVSQVDPVKVHILEVSRPQQHRWKAFKEGLVAAYVDERYMPLVSLSEMLHLREHVGQLSAEEVATRYRQLGGSIRGVIVRAKELPDQIISNALAHAGSLDAVISSSTMSGELEGAGLAHIPSTLVHFRVIEEEEPDGPLVNETGDVLPSAASPPIAAPFTRFEAVFASNYVRSQIRHKFHSRFLAMLGEMVRTADLPYTSVLQGNLYEEFVHERVQDVTPNPCPIRSLEPRTGLPVVAPILDLSGRPCVEFDDATDLAALELEATHYYKPISKSFGAVDFVLGLDTVGNMTLNLRHGISITALLRVVHAMGFQPVKHGEAAPVLRFFWLLPSRNLFKRMKKQPLSYRGRVIPLFDSCSAASPSSASSTSASSSQANPTLAAGHQKLIELGKLVQLQQFAVYMPPQREDKGKTATDDEGEQAQEDAASVMDTGEERAEQVTTASPALDSSNSPPTARGRKRKASHGQCASGNAGESNANHSVSSVSSRRR